MRLFSASCLTAAFAMLPVLALAQPPAGHGSGSAPNMPVTDKAASPAPQTEPYVGKVLQSINSGGYTYVELQKKNGEKIWLAVPSTTIPVGSQQKFSPGMIARSFESKSLNRVFDQIIFTQLAPTSKVVKDKEIIAKAHEGKGAAAPDIKSSVKKASGKNAYTIAELYKNKTRLDKKKVVVRGKVVKVSSKIMGRNWIHLQDGSGSPATADFDLVVTSKKTATEGSVILVKGTLYKGKDFGSGYKYDVIVEDASFTVE